MTPLAEGLRYHHIGIPTSKVKPGEKHLPELGLHVSGFETSPFGVEFLKIAD